MSHTAAPEPAGTPEQEPDPAGTPEQEPGSAPEAATGHPAVDTAVRELTQVADQPPGDQIPAFQAAHRTLQETLASLDDE